MESKGIRRGDTVVSVQKWQSHKRPVLAVQKGNCIYKVASFNSEETAEWFIEVMDTFLEGLVG